MHIVLTRSPIPIMLLLLAGGSTAVAAGLVGDGSADDTSALQAFLSQTDAPVLPPGNYRITQSLDFDLAETGSVHLRGEGRVRIIMAGAGPAIRVTGTHSGTASPKTVSDAVWNQQNAPSVSGLEIVGDHPQADGIELARTMQPTLRDLTIRKTRHAIHLVDRNRNVIIRDCHLYENRGVGLFLDDVNLHQINVTGCHISYNAAGGIVSRDGNVRNLHITGCDIEGNMDESPEAEPTANILLISGKGSIGEVAITGCTIQHTHDANASANIRIDLKSEAVRFTQELRHGNVTISGNVLSDVQTNIHLSNLRGATITGNTVWKGYHENLLLENCEAVTVVGNAFDRNPRYHYGDGGEAKLGLRLLSCRRCVIANCTINGTGEQPAAIMLEDSSQISITGCVLTDCHAVGILASKCDEIATSANIVDALVKVQFDDSH